MSREMKDSGVEWIGKVPIDWEVRKLSDVAERITDFVASGSFASLKDNVEYLDEPDYAMLVRTVDLSQKMVKKPVFINESAYNFLSNSNLFGGELILPNIGSVGDVYKYIPIYQRASLAPNAILVDMKEHNQYYYYYFLSPSSSEMLKNIGSDSVQLKFNKTQLRQIRVLRPRSDEQIKIAEFLDKKTKSLSNIIERTKSTIEDYKLLKQSIVTEAVTKGLNKNVEMKDSRIEWIGEIPHNWRVVRIKDITIRVGDIDHRMPESLDEGVPYVSPLDFFGENDINFKNSKKISRKDYELLSKKIRPEKGDIIYARYATIGTIRYVETSIDFLASYSCVIIKPNKQRILPEFLYLYFLSETSIFEARSYINSNTQSNVGLDSIKRFRLPLPTYDEQKRICEVIMARVDSLNAIIKRKERLLIELESYKKSLIYEYVTGKKEVE